MTKTFVLPSCCTPDSVALETAARKIEWRIERFRNWHLLDLLRGQDVVLYQKLALAHVVADVLDVALITHPHLWLAELPEMYRKRTVYSTTIGELQKLRLKFPAFIKDACEKRFPSRIYQSLRELKKEENIFSSLPVLVAEPVVWAIEFRFFILERRIMTFSPYFRYGQLAQNESDNGGIHRTSFK